MTIANSLDEMAKDMHKLLERKANLFQEHKSKISDVRQQVMKFDFNQIFALPGKFDSPDEKNAAVQAKLQEVVRKIPMVYEMFPHLWDQHQGYADANRKIGGRKTEGIIPGAWNPIVNDYGVINNEKACIELLRKIEEHNSTWLKNFQLNELGDDTVSRYILTMDMYIYAKGDEDAINKAQKIAQKEKDKHDNQAQVLKVHSAPFGTMQAKTIYEK